MRRILHIITDLDMGGAERSLLQLCPLLRQKGFDCVVLSLVGNGCLEPEFEKAGIPVYSLQLSYGSFSLAALRRTLLLLRQLRPDFLQGWMYHGNLLAAFAGLISGLSFNFGIRQCVYDLQKEKSLTRLIIKLGAVLSNWSGAIIYNSDLSRLQHFDFGYADCKSALIHNGFNTVRFCPDENRRLQKRQQLGVSDDVFLIGTLARYHPVKGYDVLLKAAKILEGENPDIRFVCAGKGLNPMCSELSELQSFYGSPENISFLPEQAAPEEWLPAFDLFVLPSHSEAFPNALGEAMSCALPCLSSAVGEAVTLLGDESLSFRAGDVQGLVSGILNMRNMGASGRKEIAVKMRQRICENFSIEKMAENFCRLYGF